MIRRGGKMKSLKAIFRRQKDHPQQQQQRDGEDLSRASSISNLDGEAKNKGALSKVRSSTKDYKNNNQVGSLEREKNDSLDNLLAKLEMMSVEKDEMLQQLSLNKGQLSTLHKEISRLKMHQEQTSSQLEQMHDENSMLRNKLRDVVHSPLSDTEKHILLFDTQRHHSSAPASIATAIINTNDWDKDNSTSASEVSVACLQDKINQMQETHYSTNEELQATLQELTDLQKHLREVQLDNERLSEEKNLMFDSLCRQTERLNDARNEVDSLKRLLYKEKDEAGHYESVVEREQKLVVMLKAAQDEREMLLVKQEQLSKEIQDAKNANLKWESDNMRLLERVRTLESTLDAKHAEHKQLDQELARAKDLASSRQIEIDGLKDLLDSAKAKIIELEKVQVVGNSELDKRLENATKEKDVLEAEVTDSKVQIAICKNEIEKFKEQVSILQEEYKVLRNNAKCTQSELEYKVEKLIEDKEALNEQLQRVEEAANELQVQAQCQLEDKRQLSSVLSETQRNMSEVESRNADIEDELQEVKKLRAEENEEWEKFQNDLLTSVRVANDFKNEAQQELQNLVMENKTHRDKIRQLEAQIDKMKVETPPIRPTSFPGDDFSAVRRQKVALNRQNSRQSVKSLIETIENAAKPIISKTGSCSRSSSTSSLNSFTSDGRTPSSPMLPTPGSPLKTPTDWNDGIIKTPLKEQLPNKQGRTDWSKTILNGDRKDPLNGLVKNGGSKRNALLKWCQNKTVGYRNIDITNFSSSWNDGLGFCALLHTYIPDRVPYDTLKAQEKRRNFSLAFQAAESVGIPTTLNINDMVQQERPDWQQIMGYVTAIYKHFEI